MTRAAFISYSRRAPRDRAIAEHLRYGFERFPQRWPGGKARSVFMDDRDLEAGDPLWPAIERALAQSQYFIVLLSPQSAASEYVAKELRWWLREQQGSTARLLLLVVDGRVTWDEDAAGGVGDFTPDSPVPEPLRGAFSQAPLWLGDLHGVPVDDRFRSSAAYVDTVLAVVAKLTGRPKAELVDEAEREERRGRRMRRLAGAGFLAVALVAVVAGLLATQQRTVARQQSDTATARRLAAIADGLLTDNLPAASLLAAEAYRTAPNAQTWGSLLKANLASPKLEGFTQSSGPVTSLEAAAGADVLVAGTEQGSVERWLRGGPRTRLFSLSDAVTQLAVDAQGRVAVATDGAQAKLWQDGHPVVTLAAPAGQAPRAVGVSADGLSVFVFAAGASSSAPSSYSVYSTGDNVRRRLRRSASSDGLYASTVFRGSSEGEILVFDRAYGGWSWREVVGWTERSRGSVGFGAKEAGSDPSADGAWVAATNGLPEIPIWSTRAAHASRPDSPDRVLRAPLTGQPTALVLSPDGSRGAVADAGTIYVGPTRDPATAPVAPTSLTGVGRIDGLTFVGGSDLLASASGVTIARWNLRQVDRIARTVAVRVGAGCSACGGPQGVVSPDGATLAMVDGSGNKAFAVDLRGGPPDSFLNVGEDTALGYSLNRPIWPRSSERAYIPAMPPSGGTVAETPSQNGPLAPFPAMESDRSLIAAAWDESSGVVLLVDDGGELHERAPDGTLRRSWPPDPSIEGDGTVSAGALLPSRRLVALVIDERVRVATVDEPTRYVTLPGAAAVHVRYAGDRLFVQRSSGTVEVWTADGRKRTRTLPGDGTQAWPLELDPRGRLMARQRSDRAVVLVDVESGGVVGTLPPPPGPVHAKVGVAFGHDGRLLIEMVEAATYRGLGTVILRDVSPKGLTARACATAGRPLSEREWEELVGTPSPGRRVCP